ncbi:phosphate ABC transporter substrate-binding protein PstS [Microbacterium sp. cx-59]|uniref:phosphate ABC transporter substrate-binding protein PstS n=1 Tax=Microbacterium sp. cx-59 TaxID=2891207 RepID=UPI001E3686F3|nr:phosphate ABC transporter substrate-binding protein PstS [Microbacterium sp. cx-59]MCC4909794.1 phosphate ABC transporter substrate-binding protein PstS [Microbacterium sp. cx-59]
MIPRFRRRAVRGALVALIVSALAFGAAVPASAASYVAIAGSGSTWSQNALDQWRRNVASNYGMTVNFSGTGSSAGRSDFIKGSVDFAVSEIPFQRTPEDGSAPEISERGYAYLPIVAGGTSLMYNLKIGGKKVDNLQMSGDVVAKIFAGQIKKWNDPAIVADNPGLALPDKDIMPVVRSDGSGSTAQFTKWMATQYPSIWTTPMTSQFPTSKLSAYKAQSGSLGVSGYVSQNYGEGSITYVEYSYAMKSGFPVVKVKNAAGSYVEPTAANVEVALRAARINEDTGSPDYLTQILDGVYNNPDPAAYPMSSYSYMIVPTQATGIFNESKGYTLGEFVKYVVCQGQKQAGALGYSPLPNNLVEAAFKQISKIPGSQVGAYDANSCSNTGAAGSGDPTTGAAPAAAGAAGGGTAAAAGTDAAAAASGAAVGGDAVYDANGNLVSGSAAGGAAAVSAPFTLASDAGGVAQIGMLAAALLLLAAVLVPPLLMRRRRATR